MDIRALGERPPLGETPENMHVFAVRQDRFGEPRNAWRREVIPTPAIKPDDLPLAHQLMRDNAHPAGNMAILINATEAGWGASG